MNAPDRIGRDVAAFFALAIALSWAMWLPLALTGRTVERGSVSPTNVPGLLGPMLAALIVTAATGGLPGLREIGGRMLRWRVGWHWWAMAFSPLALFALAAPITRLIDGHWPDWSAFDRMNGYPEMGVVGVWALVTLLNGFGEETGWRGFATHHLQRRLSTIAATLIVAACWAVWHAPLFFFVASFTGFGAGTLVGFFIGMACGAVVLTWLYNRAGQSILIVAVWHGTYNMVSGTAGADGTVAAVVSTGIIVLAITLVVQDIRARRKGRRGVLGPDAG